MILSVIGYFSSVPEKYSTACRYSSSWGLSFLTMRPAISPIGTSINAAPLFCAIKRTQLDAFLLYCGHRETESDTSAHFTFHPLHPLDASDYFLLCHLCFHNSKYFLSFAENSGDCIAASRSIDISSFVILPLYCAVPSYNSAMRSFLLIFDN